MVICLIGVISLFNFFFFFFFFFFFLNFQELLERDRGGVNAERLC